MPGTQRETSLAEAPSEEFLRALERRKVPFSVGRAIVATSHSFADQVIQAIRETGVEWQVIFNKGAAMVLPSGVNKATGLQAALESMGQRWLS